jgi:hypothetical protein
VRTLRLAAFCFIAAVGPASARADSDPKLLAMCTEMHGWNLQQVRGLTDEQMEKAVCLSAKAEMRALTTRDNAAERECIAAVRKLVEEFKRRWPQREPSEVAGKC